jgi:AcrR family transcriptional regulator
MARTTGSHSETTRPKVHQVALQLFAQHGYAAVSMRQIARDVGVQAGALYNYTPDKQSLLFELMRFHMDSLLAAYDAEDKASDPLGALEHFCRFHIRYHITRLDEVFIAYMELRNLTSENFAVVEHLRNTYEAKLEDILAMGCADGVFELEDVKVTTRAVIAMLTGVNTWYREAGRLDQRALESLYWTMARKIVGVP